MNSKLNKKICLILFSRKTNGTNFLYIKKKMEPIFIFDKTNATNFNHFKREKTSFFVAPQLDKL
jgi:hypothetical protein